MSNIFGPQPRRHVLRHGGYSLAMCRQRSIQSDAGWCLRGTEAHGARLSELSCTVTLRQGTGHTRGCCGRLRPRCCREQAKLRLSWSSETLGSKAVSSVNPRRLFPPTLDGPVHTVMATFLSLIFLSPAVKHQLSVYVHTRVST